MQTTARKLVEFESTNNGGSTGGTSSSTNTSSGSGAGTSSSTSSRTGSGNLSNATDKIDLGGGDGSNFIPSLLDGDLSPLEVILNCEILINIMILVHIIILVLVLIEKFNVKIIKNSSVGFIRKYLNKYKLNKVENFINKLGELSNKYLSVLIIINIIIIIFYICLNVYVNIELSNNLNEYISVYNKFNIKEGGIFFLWLNCKIKNKYKFSSLLVWDKININITLSGNKIKITQSFSIFSLILSLLNLNVDDTASNLTQISYGYLLLSLVALICFINVLGFMITYILIQKGNYEQKYPKLRKFINYYKNTTLLFVSIEAFLCLICLLLMVFFSFLLVYSGIKT